MSGLTTEFVAGRLPERSKWQSWIESSLIDIAIVRLMDEKGIKVLTYHGHHVAGVSTPDSFFHQTDLLIYLKQYKDWYIP